MFSITRISNDSDDLQQQQIGQMNHFNFTIKYTHMQNQLKYEIHWKQRSISYLDFMHTKCSIVIRFVGDDEVEGTIFTFQLHFINVHVISEWYEADELSKIDRIFHEMRRFQHCWLAVFSCSATSYRSMFEIINQLNA